MSLLVYGYWLLYKVQFSYVEWGFTAMAVNRAVSSHLDRVGLFGSAFRTRPSCVRVAEYPRGNSGRCRNDRCQAGLSFFCMSAAACKWEMGARACSRVAMALTSAARRPR